MSRQRAALVDRLESSGHDFLWYLRQLSREALQSPPITGTWSVHQIAAHMRDTEKQVFLARTQRILKEDHPSVSNFDQEEWNREHYSKNEPLRKILDEFRSARRRVVRLARAATITDWNKTAAHPEYGEISLDWLTLHNYSHTLEHIAQISQQQERIILDRLNH